MTREELQQQLREHLNRYVGMALTPEVRRAMEADVAAFTRRLDEGQGPFPSATGITAGQMRAAREWTPPDVPDEAELWCKGWRPAVAFDGWKGSASINLAPIAPEFRWADGEWPTVGPSVPVQAMENPPDTPESILRDLTLRDPYGESRDGVVYCILCGGSSPSGGREGFEHEPSCCWARAKRVAGAAND